MDRLYTLILLCLLSGCANQPSANLPEPKVHATSVKPVCLYVKDWDGKTEEQALADYKALPAASPLRSFFMDYERMRDQSRACAK